MAWEEGMSGKPFIKALLNGAKLMAGKLAKAPSLTWKIFWWDFSLCIIFVFEISISFHLVLFFKQSLIFPLRSFALPRLYLANWICVVSQRAGRVAGVVSHWASRHIIAGGASVCGHIGEGNYQEYKFWYVTRFGRPATQLLVSRVGQAEVYGHETLRRTVPSCRTFCKYEIESI